ADQDAGDDPQVTLAERLSTLTGGDAEALVLDHVLETVAVVVGHPSGETVDPDLEFKDIGFDSLLSMEVSKRLAASTGLKLKANLVLRYPSPRLVAGHIASSMASRFAEGVDPGALL